LSLCIYVYFIYSIWFLSFAILTIRIFIFLEMVAQTKSTARPMTSGELAVADVPPDTKGTSAMAADSTAEAS
jgi:hypothetical protein